MELHFTFALKKEIGILFMIFQKIVHVRIFKIIISLQISKQNIYKYYKHSLLIQR